MRYITLAAGLAATASAISGIVVPGSIAADSSFEASFEDAGVSDNYRVFLSAAVVGANGPMCTCHLVCFARYDILTISRLPQELHQPLVAGQPYHPSCCRPRRKLLLHRHRRSFERPGHDLQQSLHLHRRIWSTNPIRAASQRRALLGREQVALRRYGVRSQVRKRQLP